MPRKPRPKSPFRICYDALHSYYVFTLRRTGCRESDKNRWLEFLRPAVNYVRINSVDFNPCTEKLVDNDIEFDDIYFYEQELVDYFKYTINKKGSFQKLILQFCDEEYKRLLTFSDDDMAHEDVAAFIALFSLKHRALLLLSADDRHRSGANAAVRYLKHKEKHKHSVTLRRTYERFKKNTKYRSPKLCYQRYKIGWRWGATVGKYLQPGGFKTKKEYDLFNNLVYHVKRSSHASNSKIDFIRDLKKEINK